MPSVAANHGESQNGLPSDVRDAGADAGQRRRIGVDDVALQVQQPLILVAGLEDRAHLRFAGLASCAVRSCDALLQRLVQLPKLDLGLLGDRDVVGDADEADVLSGRIPARLRFRPQPAPFAVGAAIARFQHERLQRRFARDLFLQDARQVIRMQRLAPVEHHGFLVGQARENRDRPGWQRRACGRAWSPTSAPARCWRSGGSAPRSRARCSCASMRSVMSICAPISRSGATVRIALDPGVDVDPADLSVTGPDDAVLR